MEEDGFVVDEGDSWSTGWHGWLVTVMLWAAIAIAVHVVLDRVAV